jgi:hypothetical protein
MPSRMRCARAVDTTCTPLAGPTCSRGAVRVGQEKQGQGASITGRRRGPEKAGKLAKQSGAKRSEPSDVARAIREAELAVRARTG